PGCLRRHRRLGPPPAVRDRGTAGRHRGAGGRQEGPLCPGAVAAPLLDLRERGGLMALPEDLELIEHEIKHLQIEWEKFFGGVERKPPNELRAKVEALFRRHANTEIRNATERFRFQNLTSRY